MGRPPSMTLDRLAELSLEDLKAEWVRHYGAPASNLAADMLPLGIGYRLQEQKLGRVSRASRSLLRQVTARAVTTGLADLLEEEYALRRLASLDDASELRDLFHQAQFLKAKLILTGDTKAALRSLINAIRVRKGLSGCGHRSGLPWAG